jgi:signal transduction histidine kinase
MSEPLRILILATQAQIQNIYRDCFTNQTYFTVYYCETFAQSLTVMESFKPQLVLTRLRLSDGNLPRYLHLFNQQIPFLIHEDVITVPELAECMDDCRFAYLPYTTEPIALETAIHQKMQKFRRLQANHDLQTHLMEENKQLKAIMRQLAHDLGAPIRRIRSFAKLIQEQLSPAESLGKDVALYFERIHAAVDYAETLMRSYLNQERTQHSMTKEVPIVLQTCAEKAADMHDDVIRQTGTSLTIELPYMLLSEEHLLIELFENLISNSIKYHPHTYPANIHIKGITLMSGCLEIRYSDNGHGIPNELQQVLFKAFTQEEDAKEKGYGLGLNICRQIVHKLKGDLRYEPAKPKGSIFCITLPRELLLPTSYTVA